MLARGEEGGGGAATEAVTTGGLSWRNTSIMAEVGGKAWRLANGLCTVESDGLFRSYCTREEDWVVAPISQEVAAVLLPAG